MPRDYEILYIVRPELDEQQVQEAVASVNRLIENVQGTVLKTDVWGKRKLAYEVRHLREGTYVLTDFRVEPDRIPEMEATIKISDTVFRHLIVRKPDRPQRARPQKARAANQAAAEPEAPEPEAPEPAAEERVAVAVPAEGAGEP
ncbi:MAG TPA: 30S ribosomal protein S6 [Candidatus Dormibacteraeota bacterium]|nr:30S ribosomal protein S6 [Candidatus Dormibacteraeota bacterium]